MNLHMQGEVRAFATGIREWMPGHRSLARTVISVQSGNEWIILHARVAMLSQDPKEPFQRFYLRTNSLIAQTDFVPISDHFSQLLEDLIQGQLEIAGTVHRLVPETNTATWSTSALHSPYFHPNRREGPRVPTLLIRSSSRFNVYQLAGGQDALDWELKASDVPFVSVDDLARFLSFDPGNDPCIETTSQPLGVIGNASRLQKGDAEIQVNIAPGIESEALKLGYIAYKAQTVPVRASIPGKEAQWRKERTHMTGTFRFNVQDFPALALFLTYKGNVLHEVFLSDPQNPDNPRQVALNAVDDGLGNLRKYLQGDFKRSTDLEYAIATVLHLTGFASLRLGDLEQFRDFADVIAFSATGKVVVAEVTLGPIDANGKLSKLASRAFGIKQRLAQIGQTNAEVLPMVVTSEARGAITGDLMKAANSGIAVVTREELRQLAAQQNFVLNSEQAFELLKKQIP
jgi:hypothetical protein